MGRKSVEEVGMGICLAGTAWAGACSCIPIVAPSATQQEGSGTAIRVAGHAYWRTAKCIASYGSR